MTTELNPEIWGPHYWFVLHSIALTYPLYPNDIIKKKYYDFIQTLPLLIPEQHSANSVSSYIDKFPVTPYLDSRMSFIIWINRMHNYFNVYLGKEELYQNVDESIERYYYNFNIEERRLMDKQKKHRKYLTYGIGILFLIISVAYTKYVN